MTIDSYSFFRGAGWVYDILCSGIGIGAFISVVGIFLGISGKKSEDPGIRHVRLVGSVFCVLMLVLLAVTGVLKFIGAWHIDNNVLGDGRIYKGQIFNGLADGFGQEYDNNLRLVYTGEFRNNRYNGKGSLYGFYEQNGIESRYLKYEGFFRNGKAEGDGIMYVPVWQGNENAGMDSDLALKERNENDDNVGQNAGEVDAVIYYRGEFADGQRDGKGEEYFTEGLYKGQISYSGEFKDGKYQGTGKQYLAFQDGEDLEEQLCLRYEGDFNEGVRSGKGKWYNGDGSLQYEGDFENGMYNGKGIVWLEDKRYEGDFRDNQRTGHGTYYFASGAVYEGEVLENAFCGNGILTYAEDDYGNIWQYDGTFTNDLSEFEGKELRNGILVYEGHMRNGLREGEGILYYEDGTTYEGDFYRGNFEGYGVMTFSENENGEVHMYEGAYKDDQRNGEGKYYINDVLIWEGEFRDGQMNGQGKEYNYEGKLVYEGEFADDEWNGYGRYYDGAGKLLQEGEFSEGVFSGP